MKISVIVPVYNVRELLPACVASIRTQTFSDFECILVDDGSTDGSGALCDELAAADSRFRVLHKTNGGLSDARNAGLDVAKGECIAFVDSDDRLYPRALEALVAKLDSESLDVAVGSVTLHDMRTGEERPYVPLSTPHPKNILDELFNVAVWNKLYRRDVFAMRRFTKGATFEDVPVWAEILFSGAKIGYVDEPVCVYNVNREGSIVTARDYRGYPSAWAAQREALKMAGRYDVQTAADFVCRIALKFIQAYNLSAATRRRGLQSASNKDEFLRSDADCSPRLRGTADCSPRLREFYQLAQTFFRGCGPFGLSRERGRAVAVLAYLHAVACRALPHAVYAILFGPERLIAVPRLNAFLRRTLQK